MMESLRKVLCVDSVAYIILCIGALCLTIVGCIPENVVLPGFNSGLPSDTVIVPSLEVSVPDGSVDYFAEGIAFERTADEINVAFRVTEEWTVKVVDNENNPVSWCKLNTSLGSAGLHEMKVSVEENTTTAIRSARIVFVSFEDISKVAMIVVEQEGVAVLLERTRYEVTPRDTTVEVELKSNVGVEYKIVGEDWVHEQSADSRALTTSNLTFKVDANPLHKSREAKIIFYSPQYTVSDTLTIAQQGLTPTLTVPEGHTNYFAEGLVFSFMRSEAEITFHSNVEWTLLVADSTDWCSVEQTSGKAGLQKVKVHVTDNDTYEHRSATLRLMCDTTEMGEIQVVQNRENAILLARQDYTVSCEVATIDVSVNTNVDFEYKIIDADWVRGRQTATRGLTMHNLAFEIDANPSRESRMARIVFYSSEYAVADTLTIVQEGVILSVTTGDATDITSFGATLSGTVNNVSEPLVCGIIYGTSASLSSTDGTMVTTTSSGNFSVSISGLSRNSTYYYCAYVIDNGEYKYGKVMTFIAVPEGAVDLGLSVKWASCNVGAAFPEDYGDYFAWGEIQIKSSYSGDNSVTYGLIASELQSRGIIDSYGNLTASYDAATVNWGDEWRMPTKDEIEELVYLCSWSWTSQNGVNGYKVTGSNGNSIFLPAAGLCYRTGVGGRGSNGYYWSGTLYEGSSNGACSLNFGSGYSYWRNWYLRYYGLAVRPVTE